MSIPATYICEYDEGPDEKILCEIDPVNHVVVSYIEEVSRPLIDDGASPTGAEYIMDELGNEYLVVLSTDLEDIEQEAADGGMTVAEYLENENWLWYKAGYIVIDYDEMCEVL